MAKTEAQMRMNIYRMVPWVAKELVQVLTNEDLLLLGDADLLVMMWRHYNWPETELVERLMMLTKAETMDAGRGCLRNAAFARNAQKESKKSLVVSAVVEMHQSDEAWEAWATEKEKLCFPASVANFRLELGATVLQLKDDRGCYGTAIAGHVIRYEPKSL